MHKRTISKGQESIQFGEQTSILDDNHWWLITKKLQKHKTKFSFVVYNLGRAFMLTDFRIISGNSLQNMLSNSTKNIRLKWTHFRSIIDDDTNIIPTIIS